MGVDLNAFERPEGSNFDPSNPGASAPPAASAASSSTPAASESAPKATPSPPPPTKKAAPEPEPMEVDEDATAKAEAESLKKQGNETYKARKFDEAIKLYEKAWETWPKDISYLTNLAGQSGSCRIRHEGAVANRVVLVSVLQPSTSSRESTTVPSPLVRRLLRRAETCELIGKWSPSEW